MTKLGVKKQESSLLFDTFPCLLQQNYSWTIVTHHAFKGFHTFSKNSSFEQQHKYEAYPTFVFKIMSNAQQKNFFLQE